MYIMYKKQILLKIEYFPNEHDNAASYASTLFRERMMILISNLSSKVNLVIRIIV